MNVKTEFSGKMLTYLNVVSYMFCLMLGVKLNYNKLSLRRSRFLFPRHPRVMTDVFLSELGSTNTRQNHASSICSRYNLKKSIIASNETGVLTTKIPVLQHIAAFPKNAQLCLIFANGSEIVCVT